LFLSPAKMCVNINDGETRALDWCARPAKHTFRLVATQIQ
jgi:hypothetical protein